jgi:hypothetical protein
MHPSHLCFIAAFVLPALPGEESRRVDAGGFTQDLCTWEFNGGWEFKGAKGGMSLVADQGHAAPGAARLSGDFRHGGAYVAMKRTLNQPPQRVAFWAKPEGIGGIRLRLTDGAKQTFQYILPLTGGDWQEVGVVPGSSKPEGTWGGPGDGIWRGSLKECWILVSKTDCGESRSGTCLIDDVEVVAAPWVPPRPMPTTPRPASDDSIFGFSQHMLHCDRFNRKASPYWRLDYTLPLLAEGHFGVVREPLYQYLFAGDKKGELDEKQRAIEDERARLHPGNRALVEEWLARYRTLGIRTVLCPMFTPNDRPGFDDYFTWIADLATRIPLQAIELHNEPNLKHFWSFGAKAYATACKAATATIKARAPGTPVVVGSLSHLWWGPGIDFLKEILAAGTLDGADGVSVHPYRMKSAPEGGACHASADDPCGLESELRDFWALVQSYNHGNRPLGLYLTEYGFSNGADGGLVQGQSAGAGTRDRQADYLSRSMMVFFDVRLRGVPIEGVYWYDMKCDWEDPKSLEANFGLISYDTAELFPGFTAYAAIASAFDRTADWETLDLPVAASAQNHAVKSFAWRRFSDGALVLPFWRLNQLQSADEDFRATLSWTLPVGFVPGRARLHGLRGTPPADIAVTAVNGRLTVETLISARAAWIEVLPAEPRSIPVGGSWTHILPAELALPGGKTRVRIDGPRRVPVGTAPELTIAVDNRDSEHLFAGILRLDGRDIELRAAAGAKTEAKVSRPVAEGAGQLGRFLLLTDVAMVGRGDFLILAEEQLAPGGRASIDPTGQLLVPVRNQGDAPVAVAGGTWTSDEHSGALVGGGDLAPGATLTLAAADFPPVPAFAVLPLAVEVAASGRPPLRFSTEVGRTPCLLLSPTIDGDLKEWRGLPGIVLAEAKVDMGKAPPKSYRGPDDLSGTIWLGWDDTGLSLSAAFTDDQHAQDEKGKNVFRGDSIQFAVAPLSEDPRPPYHEIGLSLAKGGAEAWRWIAPEGSTTGRFAGADFQARREGQMTTYECHIPWSELSGIDPTKPGFLFSILVNDNDGAGRKGWIAWGGGIGREKNPQRFRYVEFQRPTR